MLIPPEAYILGAATFLAVATPFVLKRRRDELTSPRFWVAAVYVIVFVLRPIYILHNPDSAHVYVRSQNEFTHLVLSGMVLALGGIIALWAGYSTGLGKGLGSRIPVFRREVSPRRWRQATLALLVISGLAYGLFLRSVGGLGNLLSILFMRAAVYEADDVAGPAHSIAQFAGVAAIFGVYHHITMKRAWWTWPLVLFASVLVGTMGGRGAVLIHIWVLAYVLHAFCDRKYRTWKWLGTVFLVVAVVATGAVIVRRASRGGGEAVVSSLQELPAEFAEELLDQARGFDYMVAAMRVTGREVARREGYTYTQFFPIMVPRAIWPCQTETAGATLRAAIEPYGMGGRPPGIMGEGYMNFGAVGALAAMFLLGIWCRCIQVYMNRALGHSQVAPLLCGYALILLPKFLVGVGPFAARALLARIVLVLLAYVWSARMANAHHTLGSRERPQGTPAEVAAG